MRAAFSGRDGAALSDLFDEAVPREEGRLLLVVTAQVAANVRQGTILYLALVILSGQEFKVKKRIKVKDKVKDIVKVKDKVSVKDNVKAKENVKDYVKVKD